MRELINFKHREINKDLIDDDGRFLKEIEYKFPKKCLDMYRKKIGKR